MPNGIKRQRAKTEAKINVIILNPGRKSRYFKNYKKERQAGETTDPGDQLPKNCHATKLN